MARGKGAGVGGAPSRGRRREPRRLALPRAPGASGFAAAPRPVPTPREARAFVPFEAFAAVRAGAAEVCGSGEARARRRREGRGRRQRVRSRDSTRAEARGGARRLGGSSVRASVWIEKSAGLVRRGFGAKIRSRTARDAPFRARARHPAPAWRSFPVFPRSSAWFRRRERSLVRLSSRAQRGKCGHQERRET